MPSFCAHCSKKTKWRCTGCRGCPDAMLESDVNVFYCSKDCQKANLSVHKAECKAARARKVLKSVCDAVAAAVRHYRQHTYENTIVDVIMEDGDPATFSAILHGGMAKRYAGGRAAGLPEPLWSSLPASVQDSILADLFCEEAICVASKHLEHMLRDLTAGVSTIVFDTGRPHPTNSQHHVVLVKLQSKEIFALDLTGAQYGWHDLLVPWERYRAARVKGKVHGQVQLSEIRRDVFTVADEGIEHRAWSSWYKVLNTAIDQRIAAFYEVWPLDVSEQLEESDRERIGAWLEAWSAFYRREVDELVPLLDGVYADLRGHPVPSDDEVRDIIAARVDDTPFHVRLAQLREVPAVKKSLASRGKVASGCTVTGAEFKAAHSR